MNSKLRNIGIKYNNNPLYLIVNKFLNVVVLFQHTARKTKVSVKETDQSVPVSVS